MATGRHRVERQRRNVAVPSATAVAASSVALAGLAFAGVAAAPGADAKSTGVWDRVASCESTNNWHINTGNGFYGGLQFSGSTWNSFHGHKYASRADLATRQEQIWVARRVLESQGPNAWPVCGPNAGLTRGNGGATSTSLPPASDQYGSKRSAHHAKAKPTHHARKKHHSTAHVHHYRVHHGDTLSSIARHHHVHGGWRSLWKHNRDHVHNPNNLHVGQILRIPA